MMLFYPLEYDIGLLDNPPAPRQVSLNSAWYQIILGRGGEARTINEWMKGGAKKR